MIRAGLLGTLLAMLFLGWQFGADLARYRVMSQAIGQLESCETDAECDEAWARVQVARGMGTEWRAGR